MLKHPNKKQYVETSGSDMMAYIRSEATPKKSFVKVAVKGALGASVIAGALTWVDSRLDEWEKQQPDYDRIMEKHGQKDQEGQKPPKDEKKPFYGTTMVARLDR